ncbi:MAG: hypothetical protein LBC68_10510 [Prevotellaceae bacterium]|nr:hypothetical protein [Prevotellaceae bacterium]
MPVEDTALRNAENTAEPVGFTSNISVKQMQLSWKPPQHSGNTPQLSGTIPKHSGTTPKLSGKPPKHSWDTPKPVRYNPTGLKRLMKEIN